MTGLSERVGCDVLRRWIACEREPVFRWWRISESVEMKL